MSLSTRDFLQAREAVGALLEALDLNTYTFDVEPLGDDWRVHLECATDDGWQVIAFDAGADVLAASRTDASARRSLLREWASRLDEARGTLPTRGH